MVSRVIKAFSMARYGIRVPAGCARLLLHMSQVESGNSRPNVWMCGGLVKDVLMPRGCGLRRPHLRTGATFFRPSGAQVGLRLRPTAYAVGYILPPLRGFCTEHWFK